MEEILVIDLPLSNSPYYAYSVNLEGNSYQLRFVYNEIMKLYTLSIYDAAFNLLIAGIALVPGYPIIKDYLVEGLSGFFYLSPIGDPDVEYYKLNPQSLNKYYTFSYIYGNTTT